MVFEGSLRLPLYNTNRSDPCVFNKSHKDDCPQAVFWEFWGTLTKFAAGILLPHARVNFIVASGGLNFEDSNSTLRLIEEERAEISPIFMDLNNERAARLPHICGVYADIRLFVYMNPTFNTTTMPQIDLF